MATRKFDLTTVIIRKWWNEFNDTYFGGELTSPNRVELIDSKRVLGCFHIHRDYWNTHTTISISVYYDRDEHGYKETLLHEMIHQWQSERRLPIDHKTNFKRKAAQINRMGGWNIQRTTNVDEGVADGIKEKKGLGPAYLLKFTRNGKTPAFAFTTKNLWDKIKLNKMSVLTLKSNAYYGGDVEVYYFPKKPASCACFLSNRKQLKNYDLAPYRDTIENEIKRGKKVDF